MRPPMLLVAGVAAAATWLVPGAARAEDATESEPPPASAEPAPEKQLPPTPGERALAGAAAFFPGVLVHGTGSYVLGRPETGTPLLWMEVGGVGLTVGSLTALALTGAARGVAGVLVASTVGGMGLFTISWFGDMYAVVAPDGGFGDAARIAPRWETELGYRYVYDPRFDYRHFSVSRVSAHVGRLRLSPSLWAAPDHENSRFRLEGAVRGWGPTRGQPSTDGSYAELEGAATEHRFPQEHFYITTLEWQARGRLDLHRVAPHLEGSFAEAGVGTAYQVTRFDIGGADSTAATMLLARFAFGIYVGDQTSGGGEWQLYYDHRHDDYAAGLLLPRGSGGSIGHIGLSGDHFFDASWGLGVEAQAGSAYVVGVSAKFRDWGDQ